jgi:hypothetical protein
MQRNKLFLTLALTLTIGTIVACGLVTPAPTLEVSATQPVSVTNTLIVAQPLPTATLAIPSPIPTNTNSPLPPPVNSGQPQIDENRIKFAPGGTWAEVGTHLDEGDQIRYVLAASKGQVMSVAVEQNWPFTVEVASPSDSLTDPTYEHPFWRGVLPVTGDYTIIVKTQSAGDFTLRVAVNPPGQLFQYFDYSDPRRLYTLRYSDEFAQTSYVPAGDFRGNPGLVLAFINPNFYGPITNLSEAYFMLSAITDPDTIATCTQPFSQLESITGHRTINGYDFTQSEANGVGAGNIYNQVIYRTAYNNVCYEAVFFMHSGNIGNYPPGSVVEFDRSALLQKFEQVLSTFNVQ